MMEGFKTLIVDDEPSVLTTYRLIFETVGYTVKAASSAHEAKTLLEHDRFDLLLCDLTLESHHGGFDVIDFAKLRQPDIPAILMTGYATEDVMAMARRKGVYSVFFKPVDTDELLQTIDRLARK